MMVSSSTSFGSLSYAPAIAFSSGCEIGWGIAPSRMSLSSCLVGSFGVSVVIVLFLSCVAL